jgi:hypothetical protein
MFDTGAMGHITGLCEILFDYVPVATPTSVKCANGTSVEWVGHDTICGYITINGKQTKVSITSIKHVPSITHTLLSPLLLQDCGLHIWWTSDHSFEFYDQGVLKLFSIC